MTERIPCVGVIMFNPSGQVLLQQRDEKPGLAFPGCWTLFGGRVEPGETPDEAMRRELVEELELEGRDLLLTHWRVYDAPWKDVIVEQHVYYAPFDRAVEGMVLHEGQAMGYFTPAQIEKLTIAFFFRSVLKTFFAEFPVLIAKEDHP